MPTREEPRAPRLEIVVGPDGAGSPAADGIDDTLIEWMLACPPAQRLERLQVFVDEVRASQGG